MKKDGVFPVRVSDEDSALIDALQVKLKITSKGEIWRQALYAFAEKHKVKPKLPRKT